LDSADIRESPQSQTAEIRGNRGSRKPDLIFGEPSLFSLLSVCISNFKGESEMALHRALKTPQYRFREYVFMINGANT